MAQEKSTQVATAQDDTTLEPTQTKDVYFFPEYGASVKAGSLEEAQKLAKKESSNG